MLIVIKMLFKPYHIPMIQTGIKTETRRNWKRVMAKVGGIYPIQTKMFQHKIECEKLKVKYMFKQKLGDMGIDGANKEGYKTIEEYKVTFTKINGSWNDGLEVYVIGFKYVGKENPDCQYYIKSKVIGVNHNYCRLRNEFIHYTCRSLINNNRCPIEIKKRKIKVVYG